jgi:L-asparagine transporter-like permease
MDKKSLQQTLFSIWKGYADILKKFSLFLLALAAIVGVSLLIVLPLWYAATYAETAFTLIVLIGCTAVLLFSIGNRMYRRIAEPGFREEKKERPLKKIFTVFKKLVFLLILLYVTLLFYMRGVLFIAVPLTVIVLGLVGYFAYGNRNKKAA